MDQAHATKATVSRTRTPEIRNEELVGIANDDMTDPPAPVEGDPDLATDFMGQFTQCARKRRRNDRLLRHLSIVQTLQTGALRGLKTLYISMDLQRILLSAI